ncbi:MAG TPA: Hsp20/alpha crystallin family protein [Geminicoccus sp.]|uniref:Hsp20/alpha crystallin family protein n=1 Tax=Geminicoccus sp. TaxID=2024832 RepID=UPI002CC45D4B|nr:Hsp20/alpha crystallin family protein [Geminicoccus sp.]HWL71326.1 Hsp20/alpha crystallin family protein [Geminicoccus sp.]
MKNPDPRAWMWSNAVEMLLRAERMHQQNFQPVPGRSRAPAWEPPVDMLETDHELLVLAALPGVDPERIQVVIDNGVLVIAGERVLPQELRFARIHRLELPQGRFERQLPLPPGRYEVMHPAVVNGCLTVVLRKLA